LNKTFLFSLIILLLVGTAMGEITRKGLIAEYHFDGNAKDSSGNGNNGLVSGPVYIDGQFGQALGFNVFNKIIHGSVWYQKEQKRSRTGTIFL